MWCGAHFDAVRSGRVFGVGIVVVWRLLDFCRAVRVAW